MRYRSLGLVACFLLLTRAASSDSLSGQASYYHDRFEGRPTASGEPYRAGELTAAHRTYPFGTRLKVTRADTGHSVEVRVNDRGPHSPSRIVDLSRRAAEELDLVRAGVAEVEIEIVQSGRVEDEVFGGGAAPAVLPTPVSWRETL